MKLAKLFLGAGVLLALVLGNTAPVAAQDLSAPPPTVFLVENDEGEATRRPVPVRLGEDFARARPWTMEEYITQYFPNDRAAGEASFIALRGQIQPVCQIAINTMGEIHYLANFFGESDQEFASLRAEINPLVRSVNSNAWVRRGWGVAGSILMPWSIGDRLVNEMSGSTYDRITRHNLDVLDANIQLTRAIIRSNLVTLRLDMMWLRTAYPACALSYGIAGQERLGEPDFELERLDGPGGASRDRDDRRGRYDRDDRRDDRDDRRRDRRRWP